MRGCGKGQPHPRSGSLGQREAVDEHVIGGDGELQEAGLDRVIDQHLHVAAIDVPVGLATGPWCRDGRLHRDRLSRTDGEHAGAAQELVQPGAVSVIDLTRMTSTVLRNVVIAQILTGVFNAQNREFARWEAGDKAEQPPKTMIVLEEAHEFISAARIARMPRLFEAIETIAKRGRKRWLELVFVTQSPQHMPQQVLELVNNFVLHKMGRDAAAHVLQTICQSLDWDVGAFWIVDRHSDVLRCIEFWHADPLDLAADFGEDRIGFIAPAVREAVDDQVDIEEAVTQHRHRQTEGEDEPARRVTGGRCQRRG